MSLQTETQLAVCVTGVARHDRRWPSGGCNCIFDRTHQIKFACQALKCLKHSMKVHVWEHLTRYRLHCIVLQAADLVLHCQFRLFNLQYLKVNVNTSSWNKFTIHLQVKSPAVNKFSTFHLLALLAFNTFRLEDRSSITFVSRAVASCKF